MSSLIPSSQEPPPTDTAGRPKRDRGLPSSSSEDECENVPRVRPAKRRARRVVTSSSDEDSGNDDRRPQQKKGKTTVRPDSDSEFSSEGESCLDLYASEDSDRDDDPDGEDGLEEEVYGDSESAFDAACKFVNETRRRLRTETVEFRLSRCFTKDVRVAQSMHADPDSLVRTGVEQFLPQYGAPPTFPAEDEVEAWLCGEGPSSCHWDDMALLQGVPPDVQKALNLQDRMQSMAHSPDIHDQPYHLLGHAPGNVRMVPVQYNLFKLRNIGEVCMLQLLALVENQETLSRGGNSETSEDVDRIAGVLCALADLNVASNRARGSPAESKKEAMSSIEAFRRWLDGKGGDSWMQAVPATNIDEVLSRYRFVVRPNHDQLRELEQSLVKASVRDHNLVVKNGDGVCTLLWPSSTPTAKIAKLLCGITDRMWNGCGADFPRRPEHGDEVDLYRYLVDVVMQQGYRRHDGLVGLRDSATGLPMVALPSSHPLSCSFAAHGEHGEPYSLRGKQNIATELYAINVFRGSRRAASLFAVVDQMVPTLQILRDQLVDIGVLRHRKKLAFRPSPSLVKLWGRNAVHPLELAYLDPQRAYRLRRQLSDFGKEGICPSSCTCKRCTRKAVRVRKAIVAHCLVHGDGPVAVVQHEAEQTADNGTALFIRHPQYVVPSLGSVCAGVHPPDAVPSDSPHKLVEREASYLTVKCDLCPRRSNIGNRDATSRMAGRGSMTCRYCRIRRRREDIVRGEVAMPVTQPRKRHPGAEDKVKRICSCNCGCLKGDKEAPIWRRSASKPGEYMCKHCFETAKRGAGESACKVEAVCVACETLTQDWVVAEDAGEGAKRCRPCLETLRRRLGEEAGTTCEECHTVHDVFVAVGGRKLCKWCAWDHRGAVCENDTASATPGPSRVGSNTTSKKASPVPSSSTPVASSSRTTSSRATPKSSTSSKSKASADSATTGKSTKATPAATKKPAYQNAAARDARLAAEHNAARADARADRKAKLAARRCQNCNATETSCWSIYEKDKGTYSCNPCHKQIERLNAELGYECVNCLRRKTVLWYNLDGQIMCRVCYDGTTGTNTLREDIKKAQAKIASGALQPTHKDAPNCILGCATSPSWMVWEKSPRKHMRHYVCAKHYTLLYKLAQKTPKVCAHCRGTVSIRWHEQKQAGGKTSLLCNNCHNNSID